MLQVPWKTVQNEAVTGIRAHDPILDDRQHDLVAHQLPGIHGNLCLATQHGTCGHRFTQHIAGRDLWQLVTLHKELCLGTFAGPRRTQ